MTQNTELSTEQRLEQECIAYNATQGNLEGYDCEDCMNRGGYYVIQDEAVVFRQCHCHDIRASLRRIQSSGLEDMLDTCTLDNYNASEDWQERIKKSAADYIRESKGKWFYIGGQVGSGKTMICTAIVGELLKAGKSARYMLWRDEIVQIKACVTDDVQYSKLINPLKSVDVLYIDDFFKTALDEYGKRKPPTQGDLNVAFELLNSRYCSKDKITIISCEHFIDELLSFDEAVGSRIYERSKGFRNHVKRESGRNYRMKSG